MFITLINWWVLFLLAFISFVGFNTWMNDAEDTAAFALFTVFGCLTALLFVEIT